MTDSLMEIGEENLRGVLHNRICGRGSLSTSTAGHTAGSHVRGGRCLGMEAIAGQESEY